VTAKRVSIPGKVAAAYVRLTTELSRGFARYGRRVASISLRTATAADAEVLGRAVVDGVAEYPEFAPPGWAAPSVEAEIAHVRATLGDEQVWCTVAELDGRVVGQVTVLPASRAPRPVDDPGLAHLSNLFVDRELWGSGLARELHGAALATARGHGFGEMRLFVAAGQARARRFYEREGWVARGGEFHDPGPDLVLVEYRLVLPA
jgi:GNAT superfamily N-acetyltransferase